MENAAVKDKPVAENTPGAKGTSRLRRVMVVGAGLFFLLIAAAAFLVNRFSYKGEFERTLAEAERRGFPLDASDLTALYPDVPDDENAALVYEKAFRLYQAVQAGADPGPVPCVTSTQVPASPDNRHLPFPDEMLASSRAYLERCDEVLDLLEKASRMPHAAWSARPSDFSTEMPHLRSARPCVRLLTLAAFVETEEGDGAAAVGYLRQALAVGRALETDPFLVSALVSSACKSIAVPAAERVLARSEPPAESLIAMQKDFLRAAAGTSVAHALKGDTALIAGMLRDTIACKGIVWQPMVKDTKRTGLVTRIGITWFYRREFVHALPAFMDLADLSANPTPERMRHLALEGTPAVLANKLRICDDTLKAMGRAVLNGAAIRAKLEAAAAGVAVRRYIDEVGQPPDSLESLDDEYLGAVPIDFFTGKALIYKAGEADILIYTVGYNLIDDSGRGVLIPVSSDESGQFDDTGFRLWLGADGQSAQDGAE